MKNNKSTYKTLKVKALPQDRVDQNRKNFRVLLVYSNSFMDTLFPVSISSVSGALKQAGFDVDCFDTTFYPDYQESNASSSDVKKAQNLQVLSVNYEDVGIHPRTSDVFEDFRKKVLEYKPNLIGVSAVEPTFILAIRLLEAIQDLKIPNIIGGVHSIFDPEHVMSHDVVDMNCIGEGEECIVELCKKMQLGEDYSRTGNIWIKFKGKLYKNEKTTVQNLSTLPYLDFTIFEPERIYRPMSGHLYRMVPIEFSRGCIYKCTYCSAPAFLDNFKEQGNWLRQKPMDMIFEEIKYYRDELNVEYFYFISETFLAIPKRRLMEFLERYSEIKIPFWFNTRPETVNDKIVQFLEEVGCHRVSIGLECGNENYRKHMLRRPVSNEKMIKACLCFRDSKIELSVNNIIGYPEENRSMIMETVELNRKVRAATDAHSCSIFQPYRGTWLNEFCVEKGYWPKDKLASDLNFDPCISYPEITHDELKGLHRTFPFYIKFPKKDWPMIAKAESFDKDGENAYQELHEIYQETYFDPKKLEPRFMQN